MWPSGYLAVLKPPLLEATAEASLRFWLLTILLTPISVSRVKSLRGGAGTLVDNTLLVYERGEYVHLGAVSAGRPLDFIRRLEAFAPPLKAPLHYPGKDARQLVSQLRRQSLVLLGRRYRYGPRNEPDPSPDSRVRSPNLRLVVGRKPELVCRPEVEPLGPHEPGSY